MSLRRHLVVPISVVSGAGDTWCNYSLSRHRDNSLVTSLSNTRQRHLRSNSVNEAAHNVQHNATGTPMARTSKLCPWYAAHTSNDALCKHALASRPCTQEKAKGSNKFDLLHSPSRPGRFPGASRGQAAERALITKSCGAPLRNLFSSLVVQCVRAAYMHHGRKTRT